MARVRRSVWSLGDGWNDTLLWYAKAVKVMWDRPATDPTSWRYFAGIHGYHLQHWEVLGILVDGEAVPDEPERARMWRQCQHGSWFFLPWHRGYLSAFERVIASIVRDLGGPHDWALPYWNYSDTKNPRSREVHPAFLTETLPDGTPNMLFTRLRFGNDETGSTTVPVGDADLSALRRPQYTLPGTQPGGFGGGRSPVSHNAGYPGDLELTPHGNVHGAVGGSGPLPDGTEVPGLMSTFVTAGLDPVFWLHHANIDRLWEVWRERRADNVDPSDAQWLGGPMDRPFVMPSPDGSDWRFSCSDVLDTRSELLDYEYDDTTDPLVSAFGGPEGQSVDGTGRRAEESDTELIGTNGEEVKLGEQPAVAEVVVDASMLRDESERLAQEANGVDDVSGFYLRLEDIHGANNVGTYEVVVDYGDAMGGELPSGAPRARSIGRFSTFGLEEPGDGPEDSTGFSISLDLTPVIAQMSFDDVADLGRLKVSIVQRYASSSIPAPTIGRVSVYHGVS